jgi:hypothetical protein
MRIVSEVPLFNSFRLCTLLLVVSNLHKNKEKRSKKELPADGLHRFNFFTVSLDPKLPLFILISMRLKLRKEEVFFFRIVAFFNLLTKVKFSFL